MIDYDDNANIIRKSVIAKNLSTKCFKINPGKLNHAKICKPNKMLRKKACLKNFQNLIHITVGEVVPKMPLQVNFKSHCGG